MKNQLESKEFFKLHGAGNDFIFFDGRDGVPENISQIARKLCDRRFGVGGDGLILLTTSDVADFGMHYSNTDGTSSTCGNGIRCLGRFCEVLGLWPQDKPSISIDTIGGIVVIERTNELGYYRVNMGAPRFDASEIPFDGTGEVIGRTLSIDGKDFVFSSASMGNPHSVVFVDDLEKINLADIGPKFETHPLFPKKTNISFVKVISPKHVQMIVWERAVGITMACGTANCSILAVGVKEGRLEKKIALDAPGGKFEVELSESGEIFLTGPTEVVFRGESAKC